MTRFFPEDAPLNPQLAFWTFAFTALSGALFAALAGRRRVLRGDVAGHRRAMHFAAALIGAFLLAYVGKALVLGLDDLSAWPRWQVQLLRVHESLMVSMLLAGSAARIYAARARSRAGDAPRTHRWLGRGALIAAGCGLLTGTIVLLGMYQRAGLL